VDGDELWGFSFERLRGDFVQMGQGRQGRGGPDVYKVLRDPIIRVFGFVS